MYMIFIYLLNINAYSKKKKSYKIHGFSDLQADIAHWIGLCWVKWSYKFVLLIILYIIGFLKDFKIIEIIFTLLCT